MRSDDGVRRTKIGNERVRGGIGNIWGKASNENKEGD